MQGSGVAGTARTVINMATPFKARVRQPFLLPVTVRGVPVDHRIRVPW